jgi:DNA excision repair protein ERCC-2
MRDLLRRKDESLAPYACCGTVGEQGATASANAGVGFFCLDPAPRLRERHRKVLATIAMSATLSPIAHFRKGLGLEDAYPVAITLPSPFPAENRRVLLVPSVTTTWRERGRNYGRIARVVEQVVAARPGHYAAYFPSFRFLEAVHARTRVAPATLEVQRPRMPDRDRRAVLDRLRRDPGPVLLLAVAGGVLAEGIDLPGEALIGVIVVGPALPPVGFERDAMRRYHDERDEDGFARAMLYPGMQRVIQAAGRVHRSATDRGVIVLLGRRFTRPPYAGCLPASWSPWGVEELVTRDPRQALEEFWDAPPAGGS